MKVLMLIAALSLAQASSPVNVTGKWQWRGVAGWQRIEMNLKSEGARLTGTIRIGPGTDAPPTPEEFWEYFFDPVDFRISDGTVSGNQIRFEQSVNRAAGTQGRGAAPVVTRYLYTGLVEANQIFMTREAVPDKKDLWSLGNQRIEFLLQRVN